MGITQLMKLILDKAPKSVKYIQMDALSGKTIACDASMAIYQFLIATQTFGKINEGLQELKDSEGNLSGHLVGLFHRTIQFLEQGVKPVWVFDGKAPDLKIKELSKRKAIKEKAEGLKEAALEAGDLETAKQMSGRSVKVSKEMIADSKKLIALMGCPVIEAVGEAEAQCAEMCKADLAFGTATEDMDALTFGSNYLLRGFNSKKEPITQIDLKVMLAEFDMNMDQFVDLCILCGCDYTNNIGGIGPGKSFGFIKKCSNIESVLDEVKCNNENPAKKKKYMIPEPFLYVESRELFHKPDLLDIEEVKTQLKFTKPDEVGLKEYLITQKGFSETRVAPGIARLKKAAQGGNQVRLDCFFKKTDNKQSTGNGAPQKQQKPVYNNKPKGRRGRR